MNIFLKISLSAIVCIFCTSCSSNIRVATFNCSLNRQTPTGLIQDISTPDNEQASAIAYIIQQVNPDILLLNEFDYDSGHQALAEFNKYYLNSNPDENGALYPYTFTTDVNTGIPSGCDLNNDGKVEGPEDCFGYGQFPGQYGMVLFSKYPIDTKNIRAFQKFLWKDMPNAYLPDNDSTEEPNDWYDSNELKVFRLSSKSHWDVPVRVNDTIIHLLISHPTPPVFDGDEDRNGRRNHDEIRFWADYVTPDKSNYIYDDNKKFGGLKTRDDFIILGDLNADPADGETFQNPIDQLLNHPSVIDTLPQSKGALQASIRQAGINLNHKGSHAYDTYQVDTPEEEPGNLRLDYVLVSKHFSVQDSNVYWPAIEDVADDTQNYTALKCSDHRMVYVDLEINR